MKKFVALLLGFCVCMTGTGIFADTGLPHPDEDAVTVDMEVPITGIYAGDEVYIDVIADPDIDVYALEVKYTYDTDILRFQKIVSYGFPKEGTREVSKPPQNGKGHYLVTAVGDECGQRTNNRLMRFTFIAQKSGTTAVALQNLTLVYGDLHYHRFDDQKVSVTVKRKSDGGTGGGGGGSRPGNIWVNSPSTSTTADPPQNIPVTPVPEEEEAVFSDLSGFDWAEDAILGLNSRGIINGYEDKRFRPDNHLTRGEFAKIAVLSSGLAENTNTEYTFYDIDDTMWYTPYIQQAAGLQLMNGYEDGSFRPEFPITREEFATILARIPQIYQRTLPNKRLNINFIDEEEISAFAVGYVDSLYMAEIINGDETGAFRPQAYLTRAEATVGIWNFLQVFEQEEV